MLGPATEISVADKGQLGRQLGMDERTWTSPILRAAMPGDAEIIADYHHRCWQIGYRGLIADEILDQMLPSDRLARWQALLAAPGAHQTVVAELDGRAVAHTLVVGPEILNVYVDPNFWRQGLGRLMLAEGERLVSEGGHPEAVLNTLVGNEPALALYERAGWVRQDTLHPGEVFGVEFEEFELRKLLPPLENLSAER